MAAIDTFNQAMDVAESQTALFDYLTAAIVSPYTYDDLLRFQLVYAVSAFDKLIHDIIRFAMVECYSGLRPATTKYLAEPITLAVHGALVAANLPPPEALFEGEVVRKLRLLSFQDPDKIADGLSLVWPEKHKWQVIAADLGISAETVKTTLRLISTRRNAIVHEADIDPVTHLKNSIDRAQCAEATNFLRQCGASIANLCA